MKGSTNAKHVKAARLTSRLVRNVIFPLWARRDHPAYWKYAREFERTQFLATDALQAIQIGRLQRLLQHAHRNCVFYQRRMQSVGLRPEDLTSIEQISSLPLLTKREIQDHRADLQAQNFRESARVRNQTGGSTGSPLQFYVDRERFDSRLASTVRHNRWAGLRPGDWLAVLWGARLDQTESRGLWDWLRNTFLYRNVSLNTSNVSESGWEDYIARLRKKRPRFLLAYAQAAVLFARYLRERGIDDIKFNSIITTAEVLLPGQRQFLEDVFGGRVFNRYGCREVSVIASECEFHTGMHVNSEALLVEIVPTRSMNGPGGKIVITDLMNFSMPLIRYEVGDVGSWADDQKCPCSRGLPMLGDVQGRTTDFLVLDDGRSISGPALTLVVADMEDVRQVQFVQKGPAQVTLRVVPGRAYGAATVEELRRRLGLYLNARTMLDIEAVESIQSEASGKYRFVINESAESGVAPQPVSTAGEINIAHR